VIAACGSLTVATGALAPEDSGSKIADPEALRYPAAPPQSRLFHAWGPCEYGLAGGGPQG